MLYSLLLLLPINKWVNKKKKEIKKEKKNINSGDNHQCGDDHQWWEIAIPFSKNDKSNNNIIMEIGYANIYYTSYP